VTNSSSASFFVVSENGKGFPDDLKFRIGERVINQVLCCDPINAENAETQDGGSISSECTIALYDDMPECFIAGVCEIVAEEINKTEGFSAQYDGLGY
ncbi:MAG: hypothetical protein LBC41_11200, partial [Clostridiales bacterium]|jgi:hypothetical protein|nr:hypothetical protein [Clostridiales bacterium]